MFVYLHMFLFLFTFFLFVQRLDERLQLAEVGNTKTGSGVPSSLGGESSLVATDIVVSAGDVSETVLAGLVQPGVQETKRSLAIVDEVVVENGNDGSGGGSGGAGTTERALKTTVVDGVVSVESRNIRVGTAGLVVRSVELAVQRLDVSVDSISLIGGLSEVVGKATATLSISLLTGTGGVSTTNNGDPGARSREGGGKLGAAAASGSGVTSGNKDTDTTSTELHELGADGVGVVGGNTGLVITVGDGEGLGRRVKTNNVAQPLLVGLVVVGATTVVGRSATSGSVDVVDGVGQGDSDLGIKVSLALTASAGASTVDALDRELDVGRQIRVVLIDVSVKVGDARNLLEETSNTECGLVGRSVSLDVVVVTKALSVDTVVAGGDGSCSGLSGKLVASGRVRLLSLGANTHVREHSGRLDHGDGLVDVLGQAVAGGTDDLTARASLLVDSIVSVEQLLSLVNVDSDLEVAALDIARVDSVRGQPLLDGINVGFGRGSESIDLGLAHVLAVVKVVRVADLEKTLLQAVKVLLLKTEVKVEGVVDGGGSVMGPSCRD